MADDLYDRDFYVWTREQAQALRARRAGANDLDWDRLAEEIEDVGSEQRNKVLSFTQLILEHLFKLHATKDAGPVNHWRGEIAAFRTSLDRVLTPTLLNVARSELDALHVKAAKVARLRLGLTVDQFDGSHRWTWEQVTGEADDPLEREYPIGAGEALQ